MNLSPKEAKEALASIHNVTQKTRHSISGMSAYISLIITGAVWLIGFTATQFLTAPLVVWIWILTSFTGSLLATIMSIRASKRVRIASSTTIGRRIGLFWLLLALLSAGAIAVAHPTDGKQMTLLVILFALIGQMGMGLLVSFSATWWVVPIAALALTGYYFVPAWFYLWIALLVGGSMILLGLYIHFKW